MTLTEFLLARIAEDEAQARSHARHGVDTYAATTGPESDEMLSGWDDYDPARRVAECEAKRRILELVTDEQPVDQGHWEGHGSDERWVADHAPEILRLLAMPYADHPAYLEEWRP